MCVRAGLRAKESQRDQEECSSGMLTRIVLVYWMDPLFILDGDGIERERDFEGMEAQRKRSSESVTVNMTRFFLSFPPQVTMG